MFKNIRLFNLIRLACRNRRTAPLKIRYYSPIALGFVKTVICEEQKHVHTVQQWENVGMDNLEHEFMIRQATTVNVNAATQLLTVTLIAIQDTSERLRDTLSKEICLVRQALEWGDDGTPPHHWDQLVAVRGTLSDLNHNLRTLISYMDYAKKLATVAAEISYLSGNVVASDAICERIDHACRTCNILKQTTQNLQQESLELQQQAIITSPQLKEKLKEAHVKT